MHFTATCYIPPTSTVLKANSINGNSLVEPGISPLTYKPPTHPLNPINPDNACILRITAAAGTELADAYSHGTVSLRHVGGFFPWKSSLQPIGPSSCTRHGWFRLASIDQYSSLLPPVKSLVRVSVPVWGIFLSEPLDIIALVSRYLTN